MHGLQVKKENPDLAFGEVGKRLGALWKEVTDSEKTKFEEMAKKDKVCRPDGRLLCEVKSLSRPPGIFYIWQIELDKAEGCEYCQKTEINKREEFNSAALYVIEQCCTNPQEQ